MAGKPRVTVSFTRPQLDWLNAKRRALGLEGISETVRRIVDVQMEQEDAIERINASQEAMGIRKPSPEG